MNLTGTLFVRKVENLSDESVEVYLTNKAKLAKDSVNVYVVVPMHEQPKIGDTVTYTIG